MKSYIQFYKLTLIINKKQNSMKYKLLRLSLLSN